MRWSNQNRGSIKDTLENWDSITYNNPILNQIWLLLPGFILWQLWKERNKCIFHSKHSPAEATWSSVVNLVRETIQSRNWQPRDTDCNREEAHIFHSWALRLNDSGTLRPPKSHFSSPTLWTPPPPGFIKINFDGASKGNSGPAGYGAVIRNSTGEILTLTAGYLGETTNNVAELTGLLQGLQQALALGIHNIILEGDSQIVIQLITKILHGGHPHKISPSWHLEGLLEDFHFLLKNNISIIPLHIKRKANSVANLLANEGVHQEKEHITWDARTTEPSELYNRCKLLASRDFPTPDGVTRGEVSEGRWQTEVTRGGGGPLIPALLTHSDI